jgi:dCTP deaminase
MGFISLRTSIKFQGLINVSGFHVDPGFRGHLVYAVYNAGPSDINLRRGMPIFKIWLANLDVDQSNYIMNGSGIISNSHIDATLINSVPGEIFSMQGFSKRLSVIETELEWIKKFVTAAGIILGLLFAAMQINWRGL